MRPRSSPAQSRGPHVTSTSLPSFLFSFTVSLHRPFPIRPLTGALVTFLTSGGLLSFPFLHACIYHSPSPTPAAASSCPPSLLLLHSPHPTPHPARTRFPFQPSSSSLPSRDFLPIALSPSNYLSFFFSITPLYDVAPHNTQILACVFSSISNDHRCNLEKAVLTVRS